MQKSRCTPSGQWCKGGVQHHEQTGALHVTVKIMTMYGILLNVKEERKIEKELYTDYCLPVFGRF